MSTKHISVPHQVQAVQLTGETIDSLIKQVKNGIQLFGISMEISISNSMLTDRPTVFIRMADDRIFPVIPGDYLFYKDGYYAILPRLIFESMYVLPKEDQNSETLGYDNFGEVVEFLRKYSNLESVMFRFFSASSVSVKSVELNVNGK